MTIDSQFGYISGIEGYSSKQGGHGLRNALLVGISAITILGISAFGLAGWVRMNSKENENQLDYLVNHTPKCYHHVELNQGFDAFSERHMPKELRQKFNDKNSRKAVQIINNVSENHITHVGEEFGVPCLIKEHHPEYWKDSTHKYPGED